jgi:hypothetical protein
MTQLRFPPIVWFAIASVGVYGLWSVLSDSFVEPNSPPRVHIAKSGAVVSQVASMIVASAETTASDAVNESSVSASNSSAAAVTCRDDEIKLSKANGADEMLCVESSDIIQNGESRVYRFNAQGKEAWVLNVLTTGTTIESVEFTSNKSGAFRCESDQCAGIAIHKRDATGRRTISFDAKLASNQPVDPTSGTGVVIRALLKAKHDQDVAALTCSSQGVTMIGSNNWTIHFCPLGGNGFSADEDGSNLIYQFRNLEGETITIHVDKDESIKKVGFDEERLVCLTALCAGIQISPPNANGERIVNFSGLMLSPIDSNGESLTLNGSLILQPIN